MYGFISIAPLIIGAIIGVKFRIKEKIIGGISSFGAGTMIAALSFGLMEESFRLGGFDNSIVGFLLGGIIFVIGDIIIIKIGGRGHKDYYDVEKSTGWGIVLGAGLDGIPESIALGLGLLLNQQLGLLVLVGVFLSNLPEAISSAYDLKLNNKSTREIIFTWLTVALASFIFVILGYTLFANLSASLIATFEALAAGAILAMLASTMMPEAYKESGTSVSILTVLGFMAVFILSKLGA